MQNFFDFYNTECMISQQKENMQPGLSDTESKVLTYTFTQNFNGKLFTDHFPELTIYSPGYRPGVRAMIMLNSIYMGVAVIEAVRNFAFASLRDPLCYLNIGKPLHYQAELLNRLHGNGRKLDGDAMLSLIAFGYIDRNMEAQNELITEWWCAKQNENDKL